MRPPCAVIAEDEPLLRTEIRRTLLSLWPTLDIAAEAANGHEALLAIERHSPDFVFLDILMPGLDGLAVAERIGGRSHVVFITAYDQHTLEAFERGALDYVLKPITAERMSVTVARLQDRLHQVPSDMRGLLDIIKEMRKTETRYVKWLTVPRGDQFKLITVGEISYLRADNKYTTLVTPGDEYLLTTALKEIREMLDPDVFWQIHRSVVVNVSAIESVFRSFRGALELKMKERPELLPVSSAHAHLFKRL